MKVIGAPGTYEVDWWSPELGDEWEPVDRGAFDDFEVPESASHLV